MKYDVEIRIPKRPARSTYRKCISEPKGIPRIRKLTPPYAFSQPYLTADETPKPTY